MKLALQKFGKQKMIEKKKKQWYILWQIQKLFLY